jgi:hypothetical protein
LHFKLKILNKQEVAKEELKKHSLSWFSKKEAKNIVSFDSNKYIIEQFLEKETSYNDDGILINSKEFN